MNELENRVWRGLRDLADTVPHTPDARARLDARLAGRRRRRPLAVVAAAVVVVAAVVVPVVLVQREGNPSVTTTPTPTYAPPPRWVELGEYVENGVTKHAGLSVDQDGKGWCVETSDGGEPKPVNCFGVPDWDGHNVRSVAVLGGKDLGAENTGPLPDLLLFVTAPQVATLDVFGRGDEPVKVREVARTARAVYFLADFDGSTVVRSYTARDAAGKVVD